MGELSDKLLAHVGKSLETISLNQLARETAVDVASLHRWIKGERSISLENADRLTAYYKLQLRPRKPRRRD